MSCAGGEWNPQHLVVGSERSVIRHADTMSRFHVAILRVARAVSSEILNAFRDRIKKKIEISEARFLLLANPGHDLQRLCIEEPPMPVSDSRDRSKTSGQSLNFQYLYPYQSSQGAIQSPILHGSRNFTRHLLPVPVLKVLCQHHLRS